MTERIGEGVMTLAELFVWGVNGLLWLGIAAFFFIMIGAGIEDSRRK